MVISCGAGARKWGGGRGIGCENKVREARIRCKPAHSLRARSEDENVRKRIQKKHVLKAFKTGARSGDFGKR